jgi:hypothetical protein
MVLNRQTGLKSLNLSSSYNLNFAPKFRHKIILSKVLMGDPFSLHKKCVPEQFQERLSWMTT